MYSVSLHGKYSTTRLLTTAVPFTSDAVFPFKEIPLNEGGLRAKGFFKSGYKKCQDGWCVYRNEKEEELLPDFKGEETCEELPLLTVVTVVYNSENTLEETVKSVIGQSYQNVEFIIIDGGSIDSTLDIIRRYNFAIDYWKSERDSGIYDAMNKALAAARGDWVIFMGADDRFSSDKSLECAVSRFKDRNSVYYGNVILSGSCKVYGGRFNKYKLMQQNICHQSIFYPASVFVENRYDLKYKMLADYNYNMNIFGLGVRFVYLPMVVSIFNEVGVSSGGDAKFTVDKDRIIRRSFGMFYLILKKARTACVSVQKMLR